MTDTARTDRFERAATASLAGDASALSLLHGEAELEADRYRKALEEIDRCCSFGADREGMTAMGVKDLRRQVLRALGRGRS